MRAVNLIPAEQQSGRANVAGRSEGAAFIVLGLIAGLAILAFTYGSARHEVSSRRVEAANIAAQAQSAESQASKLAPYTSFISLHEERVKEVSSLIGERFDWAHVFHELGRVLPSDVTLTAVQGGITGASTTTSAATGGSVSSATPPGSTPTLTLAGCTNSQSEVAVMLTRLRLIDGVSEVQLSNSTKQQSGGGGGTKAGGTTAASSSSPCKAGGPTFSVVVTFAGLPTPTAPSPHSGTAPAALSTPSSTAASGGNQ